MCVQKMMKIRFSVMSAQAQPVTYVCMCIKYLYLFLVFSIVLD